MLKYAWAGGVGAVILVALVIIFFRPPSNKEVVPVINNSGPKLGLVLRPTGYFSSQVSEARGWVGDAEDGDHFEMPTQSPLVHLYCSSGLHIGFNHDKQEIEVPPSLTNQKISLSLNGYPNWIYIPLSKYSSCRFVISTSNHFEYLKRHPEISSKLSNPIEKYEIYARYTDKGIFDSKNQKDVVLKVGLEAVYNVTFENGTSTPTLSLLKEVPVSTSTETCPNGIKYCQYF